jgi:phosphopantothenoylcysteine decarboxylase/phosphopantothenate--cysteine ligase
VGVELLAVQTALEMHDAVLAAVRGADALLMAAAVADFRPAAPAELKIKKTETGGDELTGPLAIPLTGNPDILAAVKAHKAGSGWPLITLGFAAETHNALAYGQDKLERKGLDFIAVNDVSAADAGFAVDTNRVILLSQTGPPLELPWQSKTAVAEQIVAVVAQALQAANTG